MNHLMPIWNRHQRELRRWLQRQLPHPNDVDDLLQELFLKVLRHHDHLDELNHTRAWLFTVARHTLIDHLRLRREWVELPEELFDQSEELPLVDRLASCLPCVLAELSEADHQIIAECDLQGVKQEAFAQRYGLKLSTAKSRLQRARKRLKGQLEQSCHLRYDEQGQLCCFEPCAKEPL